MFKKLTKTIKPEFEIKPKGIWNKIKYYVLPSERKKYKLLKYALEKSVDYNEVYDNMKNELIYGIY